MTLKHILVYSIYTICPFVDFLKFNHLTGVSINVNFGDSLLSNLDMNL